LTFWVDPLDGSSGLAQGHTEHLTCIIGISYKKRPLLGIVHKPFVEDTTDSNNSKSLSDSLSSVARTYVGLPESGLFTIDSSNLIGS
jgi:3'-phosphoadenosine 5'-phosphosulfate (PAPS) 3'-phosphatase